MLPITEFKGKGQLVVISNANNDEDIVVGRIISSNDDSLCYQVAYMLDEDDIRQYGEDDLTAVTFKDEEILKVISKIQEKQIEQKDKENREELNEGNFIDDRVNYQEVPF